MDDTTEEIKNRINDILASSDNLPNNLSNGVDDPPKSNLQRLFDIDDNLDFKANPD